VFCTLAAAGPVLRAADLAHGKLLYQQTCGLCHATALDQLATVGQGPLLAGIVGRPAASLSYFGYSQALRDSKITWDADKLDRFLAAPGNFVPGTNMVIVVPVAADRSDLIAYLETLPRVEIPPGFVPAAPPPGAAPDPGDWRNDGPGVRHTVKLADLPKNFATPSANSTPSIARRPEGAVLSVPPGFTVQQFASGLSGPRLLRTAPNGDIFIAETRAGRIRVLRAADGAGAPSSNTVFADNLRGPFGIAFYPLGANPRWVYVGNLNTVVRFPYRNGDLVAGGPPETIVPVLSDTTGGHTTRDVAFSLDGRRLFISVGSGSNVAEGMETKSLADIPAWEAGHGLGATWGSEAGRANIVQTDPEGRQALRAYATGIRNPVGLAVNPANGEVWCSTNERDALGDDLVPDYITHVREGGYYGWPWYYMGNHEDPRHAGERPDLAGKAIVPDVPVQAHSASLEMTFYTATAGVAAFPAEYRGEVFAAFHGSWNRSVRTGSKVVRVRLKNGVPTGEYEDFLTGFVIDNRQVWGRPVGVTVAHDGALLVTEDVNGTVWRIAYTGGAPRH
jgi:glucose/arabinose dehydrogenase